MRRVRPPNAAILIVRAARRPVAIALGVLISLTVIIGALALGIGLGDLRRGPSGAALASAEAGTRSVTSRASHVVPWVARQAPPWTPVPQPTAMAIPTVRSCRSADLVTAVSWSAGLGHSYTTIAVGNRSTTSCQLFGVPTVFGFDRARIVTVQPASAPVPGGAPVLLEPGHSTMPGEPWQRSGDAKVTIEWVPFCGTAVEVESLILVLPGTKDQLAVSLPADGKPRADLLYRPRCDLGAVGSTRALLPTAFMPSVAKPEPTPTAAPLILTAAIDSPRQVTNDRPLQYLVTLTNSSMTEYRFDGCPIYTEQFVKNYARFFLNCEGVGALAPGESATFEMRLGLDPNLTLEGDTWDLVWHLEPYPNSADARARISVISTGPAPSRAPKPSPAASLQSR